MGSRLRGLLAVRVEPLSVGCIRPGAIGCRSAGFKTEAWRSLGMRSYKSTWSTQVASRRLNPKHSSLRLNPGPTLQHPCVCASGSGPGLRHEIQGPRVMWLHNPASRPNSASPPNVASGIRRHHLVQRQQFGVTTQCGFRIRRHHPLRRQETIRRHDPIRSQGTVRRQTMWRHNSASPKAMRLQEFGFGVRSFTTLPRAAALQLLHIRKHVQFS